MSEQETGVYVKLPTQLVQKLKEYCEQNSKSQKEIIIEALEAFFKRKTHDTPSLKQIIVRYASKCAKCGRNIDVGEVAYYGGGLLICFECFTKSSGHLPDVKKALNAYTAYRRYKALAQEAKRELDDLVDKINEIQILDELNRSLQKIDEITKMLHDYMMSVKPDDNTLLTVKTMLTEISEKIEEIIAARAIKTFKKPKWIKRERELNH